MKNIVLQLCLLVMLVQSSTAKALLSDMECLVINDTVVPGKTSENVNHSLSRSSDEYIYLYSKKRVLKSTLAASAMVSDIVYYDGLGRPYLKSALMASPSGGSISKLICYDSLGRQDTRTYLPYVSSELSPNPYADLVAEQKNFYRSLHYTDDLDYTYAENVYEKTPMNRVVASWRPGKVFRDRGKKAENQYGINASGSVFNLVLQTGGVKVNGYYDRGTLRRTDSRNEDGQEVQIFKDGWGNMLLERHIADDGPLDTYYVYDDSGNLCWVFPPEASARLQNLMVVGLAADWVRDYCYYYDYDAWRNLRSRKRGRAFGL